MVSYVPTSKEAEELDDSFMFSDDIFDGNRRVFTILQVREHEQNQQQQKKKTRE